MAHAILSFSVSRPDNAVRYPSLGDLSRDAQALLKQISGLQGVEGVLHQECTVECARKAIEAGVAALKAQEQLTVTFVGHGDQWTPTGSVLEISEFWMFKDGGLQDAWLFTEVKKALEKGSDVLIVSDACRGGGMLGNWRRLLSQFRSGDALRNASRIGRVALLSPVSLTENTRLGFTRDVSQLSSRGTTYNALMGALQQSWPSSQLVTDPFERTTVLSKPALGFLA